MKKIFFGFLFALLMIMPVFGQDQGGQREGRVPEYLKEFGVMTGYGHGNLMDKGSYKLIPVILRLGNNLDAKGWGLCDLIQPIADKLKMKPKGYTSLVNEFNLNGVWAPDSNIEAGWTLLIKYSYPVTEKFHPYAIGGVGLSYITQHTQNQSLQFGFTPQFGTGFSYFIKKNWALNAEYRRHHFSNANIKRPNSGINVDTFLLGLSHFY